MSKRPQNSPFSEKHAPDRNGLSKYPKATQSDVLHQSSQDAKFIQIQKTSSQGYTLSLQPSAILTQPSPGSDHGKVSPVNDNNRSQSPFSRPFDLSVNHTQSRIHRLYKGALRQDVEKEKNLTQYTLNNLKQQTKKFVSQAEELKLENEEIKRKIKRYGIMYEEKKAYVKAEQNKVVYDDSLEQSVTKKIGYTELGQLSDGRTDTAMQFNKSINNEHVRK